MNALRVLIVDDSSVMRKIVDRSLRQAGLQVQEVFEASNGVEALARMQQTPVDLILTDINMPVMDGEEFVRRLRASAAAAVPVIVVSTDATPHRIHNMLDLGTGYLQKPFGPEQLRDELERVLLAGKEMTDA